MNIKSWLKNIYNSLGEGALIFCGFLFFYLVLFYSVVKGSGQYWDSTFPYFKDQISNFYNYQSYAWVEKGLGAPLGYSSDYIFRFVLSQFDFFQPEVLKYLFLSFSFSLGSLGIYLILNKQLNWLFSILLSLTALVNPSMQYKLLAGHWDYVVSYVVFIYLIHYLIEYFDGSHKSYVTLSIILGLIGAQIQFFVFGAIAIFSYLVINFDIKKIGIKKLCVLLLVPLLINIFWIGNFLTTSNLNDVSTQATKGSFLDLKNINVVNIFNLSFSKATLISKNYSENILTYNLFFFVLILAAFIFRSRNNGSKKNAYYGLMLVLYSLFSLGVFFSIDIKYISTFYPMFREAGHLSSIIILVSILLLSTYLVDSSRLFKKVLVVYLVGFLLINFYVIRNTFPVLDYGDIRNQFSEFYEFSKKGANRNYKVLTYPFFDQYSFLNYASTTKDGFRLDNTGKDSFITFLGVNYIDNVVPPYNFKNSVQYLFLDTYDLSLFRDYSLGYIYDFSNIYESNYNKYVPSETYDNDLTIIKNRPDFIDQILINNPNKLTPVSKNIYKIENALEDVFTVNNLFYTHKGSDYNYLRMLSKKLGYGDPFFRPISTTTSIKSPYIISLFSEKNSNTSSLITDDLYTSGDIIFDSMNENKYIKLSGNVIDIYRRNLDNFYFNSKTVAQNEQIRTINTEKGRAYYLFDKNVIKALENDQSEIVLGNNYSILKVNNKNYLENGGFDNGLWQEKVEDCNNYDTESEIGMNLADNDGNLYLSLNSSRHVACTNTSLKILPGDYIFSFDYNSPTLSYVGYYIELNDKERTVYSERISADSTWKKFHKKINIPSGVSSIKIFVYGYPINEEDRLEGVANYDNFKINKIERITNFTDDDKSRLSNKTINLLNGENTFYFDIKNDHNLIDNFSFESGLWSEKVEDCYAYDNNPQISMVENFELTTNGSKSLELNAVRHAACVRKKINVESGKNYKLTFDYYPITNTQHYFAYFFNGNDKEVKKIILPVSDKRWNKYEGKILVPDDASEMTLYLYAFQSDKTELNRMVYDNFSLTNTLDLDNKYIFVNDYKENNYNIPTLKYEKVNPTRRIVHISGANGGFYIGLSQSFHPKWKLALYSKGNFSGLNSYMPLINSDYLSENDHFKLDDLINGWYVDPTKVCYHNKVLHESCRLDQNGNYDIDLIIEFSPQRWFNVGIAVSILSIFFSLLFVLNTTKIKKND